MTSQYVFQPHHHLSLPFEMTPPSEINALAGALGSVIGYLGAEAAEVSVFERLLWPQRFYNHNSFRGAIMSALLMPMGGPLHKAALDTLDRFRRKGLYGGMQHGHMLGTAFYANTELKYKLHGYAGTDFDNEVRNGLWVTVLQRLRRYQTVSSPQPVIQEKDSEMGQPIPVVRRTSQKVQHLRLSVPTSDDSTVHEFCEDSISFGAIFTVVASEISAIACVIILVLAERCFWFSAYLCLPLLLKLTALTCSIRREPAVLTAKSTETENILVEISDYDHGFPLISGPEYLVRQFFRHYAHPVRENNRDRAREVMNIGLVLAFVLYFPIGLLSMLWVTETVQVVWLSYQMYTIVVMHVNRLVGIDGPGRIEDSLAFRLAKDKKVRLRSQDGAVVEARLETIPVSRIAEGKKVVQEIVGRHKSSLSRSDSDSSQTSTLCGGSETALMGSLEQPAKS